MLGAMLALVLQWPVSEPCPDDQPHVQRVSLGVGTQKVLSVPTTARVRVMTPGVVEAMMLGPGQLLVNGRDQGSTRVTVEEDGGVRAFAVTVAVESGCFLGFNDLATSFPCGSTLEVRTAGDRVFLDGEASSVDEWRAALAVSKAFPHLVVRGHLKTEVIEREFRLARAALEGAGFARVRWVRAGNTAFLKGEVDEEALVKVRALEAEWRPRLELVLASPPAPP
jgi:pilus assembly protein CpaC